MNNDEPIQQEYQGQSPAQEPAEVRLRHAANRIGWNEGAAWYTAQLDETIAFLRNGGSNLHPIEQANLGDLRSWCASAIHLQCAAGLDTLSLWNEGVSQVVGVDIADVQIANARRLSDALNAPATWYCCDVLDTPHELDGTADLVYTGRGSLCWLHDLTAWAAVVYRLLKPGGIFHVLDDHPVSWLFDQDATTLVASGLDYFEHSEVSQGWPTSYIGDLNRPVEQHARKYERLWPLASIFQALTVAGLIVDYLGEHPEHYWNAFPNMEPHLAHRIPQTFSLRAHRPTQSGAVGSG
jgi:SAM-dependent methyltransferase